MDSMSIHSTFLRELISKRINKLLEKKLEVNPDILLEEFVCNSAKTHRGYDRTVISLRISLPTTKFREVLQEVIK